jgi:hypothetical protein
MISLKINSNSTKLAKLAYKLKTKLIETENNIFKKYNQEENQTSMKLAINYLSRLNKFTIEMIGITLK